MSNNVAPPKEHNFLENEVFLDEYHPDNQTFMKDLKSIKHMIVAQSMSMKPWHVEAVKLKLSGSTLKDIGEQLNHSVTGTAAALQRQDALKLRQMLEYHNVALEGPNEAHRKRVLWEIVIDNQDTEPKTSLSGIAELNKMDGSYAKDANTGEIKVVINNNMFPKGKLDQ